MTYPSVLDDPDFDTTNLDEADVVLGMTARTREDLRMFLRWFLDNPHPNDPTHRGWSFKLYRHR